MNFAVLIAPDFELQAVQRSEPKLAHKPVALVDGEGRKAHIAQVSPEALGITPGLVVTLAMARCPGLILRPRDPNAEAEMRRLLLAAAFTLSPRVEATADGCCTIDLQGSDALRTEKQMLTCVEELAQMNLIARAGAGATPQLASYAARLAAPVLIVHEPREFLGPLPLALAEPTIAQSEILRGWGITSLGQLTNLPKAEIGQRLGTDGVLLWERAAGETTRVLHLIEPAKTFAAEWTYEPPVETMEPLLFRLRRFAECVAMELRAASRVAESLTLTLLLEDESDYRREFRLPEPGANVDGWMRILLAHLETVETDAAVTGVRLVAAPARPPERQQGLFETGLRDRVAFWENLARVAALVGDDRVGTPETSATWRPDTTTLVRPSEAVPEPESDPIHPPCGLTLRRFRPPWAAHVVMANDRPAFVEAPGLHETVRLTRGPFQWSGAWWKPGDAWAFEIWEVELDSGATYQLARTAAGWCVEGVLD